MPSRRACWLWNHRKPCLENYPKDKINEVVIFCNAVGLPISLEQLGIKNTSRANLMKAAEIARGPRLFMKSLSSEVPLIMWRIL